eukprot:2689046-Prymnesium_polylepis.1
MSGCIRLPVGLSAAAIRAKPSASYLESYPGAIRGDIRQLSAWVSSAHPQLSAWISATICRIT